MGRIGPFRWSGSLTCSAALERLGSPRFIRPSPAMRSVLTIILIVLDIYIWLLIAAAVLSWLVAFNVVNSRNQFVAMIGDFLYRITEPVLRPIRSVLPTLGGAAEVIDRLAHDVIDLHGLAAELELAGLEPCDIEQIVDEAADVMDLALDDAAHAVGDRRIGVRFHQLDRGLERLQWVS